MVSFAAPEQVEMCAEICQSFCFDNGAFTAWRRGEAMDFSGYYAWVERWMKHPGFDFAIIPDVIDGDEDANDKLAYKWPLPRHVGVPVWHLHESLSRLHALAKRFPRIAFGSSGEWSEPGTQGWWVRMAEALDELCDDSGRPMVKLHGLRMLDTSIFTRLPFSSADSTNAARNVGLDSRWRGTYAPKSKAVRGIVLCDRIESHNSAPTWSGLDKQQNLDIVFPQNGRAGVND
jgi:hypothetical protein